MRKLVFNSEAEFVSVDGSTLFDFYVEYSAFGNERNILNLSRRYGAVNDGPLYRQFLLCVFIQGG